MKIRLIANTPSAFGLPSIVAHNGESRLIQIDWEYPAIASAFGWSPRLVQNCPECGAIMNVAWASVQMACPECSRIAKVCLHDETDGTVDCKCGLTAGYFIAKARQWIDDHDGATADDPGYFNS